MLDQHDYYVYYEGNVVYARQFDQAPVILQTFPTPQDAADHVQSIVNPLGISPSGTKEQKDAFEAFGPKGFNSDEFQNAISDNCKQAVLDAYANPGS